MHVNTSILRWCSIFPSKFKTRTTKEFLLQLFSFFPRYCHSFHVSMSLYKNGFLVHNKMPHLYSKMHSLNWLTVILYTLMKRKKKWKHKVFCNFKRTCALFQMLSRVLNYRQIRSSVLKQKSSKEFWRIFNNFQNILVIEKGSPREKSEKNQLKL